MGEFLLLSTNLYANGSTGRVQHTASTHQEACLFAPLILSPDLTNHSTAFCLDCPYPVWQLPHSTWPLPTLLQMLCMCAGDGLTAYRPSAQPCAWPRVAISTRNFRWSVVCYMVEQSNGWKQPMLCFCTHACGAQMHVKSWCALTRPPPLVHRYSQSHIAWFKYWLASQDLTKAQTAWLLLEAATLSHLMHWAPTDSCHVTIQLTNRSYSD